MDNITLLIRGKEFTASKSNLSQYSDYFQAMFSGNYVENEKQQVKIDVLDSNIMNIILEYMRLGFIDLSEHSLTTIGEIAVAANFLQVTELIKQIKYTLDIQLSVSNWVETMQIAESATFLETEKLAAAHGLFSFKRMKPEYIPNIRKLFWYLSHPYLDVENEFEVFKFGHEWIMQNESGGDALLLVLCCLDYKRLTIFDLKDMMGLLGKNYANSLAERIIECLSEHAKENQEFFMSYFTKNKLSICKKFTERVYKEVLNLIKASTKRKLVYTPAVPMWVVKDSKPEVVPHYLYTYKKETGFKKWLEVADKNLWGWSVISWGLTKIVVVCGEHGRGTGIFMKDVKVYDTLRKEWINHGVELPSRRHAGLAIIDDSLYILGGVGTYRVVYDTVIVYDLKERTFRKIASLPDALHHPAVCTHNNEVYACGQRNIYKYSEDRDCWTMVVNTDMRASCMISYKGSLLFTQNYFTHLYRFKSGEDDTLVSTTQFNSPPAALCNLGNKLMVFTRTMCGHADIMAVEEYTVENDFDDKPKVLWMQNSSEIKVNDVAGFCVLVTDMPPMNVEISQTHKRYLERFPEE